MAHSRGEARLLKRAEYEDPAWGSPWPPDPEPPGPPPRVERTRFQEWHGTGAQLRTSGPGSLVRLDAVLPFRCPPELAEYWILRGQVPGRVYKSGWILANPDALRRRWREYRESKEATQAEGVES